MKFEEFVKEVMYRANLSSRAQAQEAVRATLETLSEHLTGGEAGDLLDQLDPRLGVYLQQPTGGTAQGKRSDRGGAQSEAGLGSCDR